jgi:hypothetical protein
VDLLYFDLDLSISSEWTIFYCILSWIVVDLLYF